MNGKKESIGTGRILWGRWMGITSVKWPDSQNFRFFLDTYIPSAALDTVISVDRQHTRLNDLRLLRNNCYTP